MTESQMTHCTKSVRISMVD